MWKPVEALCGTLTRKNVKNIQIQVGTEVQLEILV